MFIVWFQGQDTFNDFFCGLNTSYLTVAFIMDIEFLGELILLNIIIK